MDTANSNSRNTLTKHEVPSFIDNVQNDGVDASGNTKCSLGLNMTQASEITGCVDANTLLRSTMTSLASSSTSKDIPPPPFAPYVAEHFVSNHGDIISHDHHLNEDGEALYRFLLSQSETPPVYSVSLRGTHLEHRTRTVRYTDSNGHSQTRIEHYTETVTDFDFAIDLTHDIVPEGPEHWSVPDADPAFRGLMVRQVTVPRLRGGMRDGEAQGGMEKERAIAEEGGGKGLGKVGSLGEITEVDLERGVAGEVIIDWKMSMTTRKATSDGIDTFYKAEFTRLENGAAPWENSDGSPRAPHEASSKTVREWADEYAASPKLLKEFVYEKTTYGWNIAALRTALYNSISSCSSSATSFHVNFELSSTKIIIRPDTRLARLMSLRNKNFWWAALLWISLIYPVLWLFRRYASRGGGRWVVCGGAYAMKLVENAGNGFPGNKLSSDLPTANPSEAGPSTDSPPTISAPSYSVNPTAYPMYPPQPYPNTQSTSAAPINPGMPPNPRIVAAPNGALMHITGFREGEWFRMWEPTIQRCVTSRTRNSEPFVRPYTVQETRVMEAGVGLDGYT